MSQPSQQFQRDISQTPCLLAELGPYVNLEKSHLQPTQTLQFIGAMIHVPNQRTFPLEDRTWSLPALLEDILLSSIQPVEMVQHILGHMAARMFFIPCASLHMNPLQLWFLHHFLLTVHPESAKLMLSPPMFSVHSSCRFETAICVPACLSSFCLLGPSWLQMLSWGIGGPAAECWGQSCNGQKGTGYCIWTTWNS